MARRLNRGLEPDRRQGILQGLARAHMHVHIPRGDERNARLTAQGSEPFEPLAIVALA